MPKLEDALISELRGIFPEAPPAHSRPFGQLLAELRAEGRAVTSTSLRRELNKLVKEGKWRKARVGNSTHYWPKSPKGDAGRPK